MIFDFLFICSLYSLFYRINRACFISQALVTGCSLMVRSFRGHLITSLDTRAASRLAQVYVCPEDFESQALPPLVYLASLSINTNNGARGGTTDGGSRGIS